MPFTKAVTDYFSGLPVAHRQRILDRMKTGLTSGMSKADIRSSLYIPDVPEISTTVFNDLYDMMVRAKKWNSL
jgi:hypothetical protein